MSGTPTADPMHLASLVLELQALIQVVDARQRALLTVTVDALTMLGVKPTNGETLRDQILRLGREELEAKLAQAADSDAQHASYLKRLIAQAESEGRK